MEVFRCLFRSSDCFDIGVACSWVFIVVYQALLFVAHITLHVLMPSSSTISPTTAVPPSMLLSPHPLAMDGGHVARSAYCIS
jgi:hypothetical protein